jgi:hypothetical protein
MLVAGLAARRFGFWLRRILGERRGLTLARPQRLLEPPGQQRVLLDQPTHFGFELRDSPLQDHAIGARRLGHADRLEKRRPISCASLPEKSKLNPEGSLNNYDRVLWT